MALLKLLLRGDTAQDGLHAANKLALHVTILLGLLFLGALQHFLRRRGASGRRAEEGKDGQTEDLATVEGIYVYPIKSCAASRLKSVELLKKGLELDRNWAVVQTDTHTVFSLRQEPRLTLVQPTIDEDCGVLRMSLSKFAEAKLPPFSIPLRPSQDVLKKWKLLPELPMWGDAADGRIVEAVDPGPGDLTPQQWFTELLGYPAALVQFDTTPSSASRVSYPIFRPPEPGDDTSTLEGPRDLHFADEYPLLIATVESLQALEGKIADGLHDAKSIAGLSRARWLESNGDSVRSVNSGPAAPGIADADGAHLKVDMRRFRPNIVLRSAGPRRYAPFAEDEWDTLWFLPPDSSASTHHAKLYIVARCARCLLTTVDPTTAERDPVVPLRVLARDGWRMRVKATTGDGVGGEQARGKKQACFGMYACPVPSSESGLSKADAGYGHVSVGDRVRVRWRRAPKDGEED